MLACELKSLCADVGLQRMLTAIELKIEVFDQLRRAMRMAEVGAGAGLNSGGADRWPWARSKRPSSDSATRSPPD